ncbi:MAG: [citrate (pro-3S)-lyase] ligase [Clostridia bacterium]
MEGGEMLSGRAITGPGRARARMIDFLRENGLGFDEDIAFSYALMDGARIAACGSLAGDVLKCLAVAPEYRALGLSARIVGQLCEEAAARGKTRLFLATKPENIARFEGLGFYLIARCEQAALLENARDGLARYVKTLEPLGGVSGCVVLNANPFTLGHLHLVQTAARRVDHLHVFVVGEDASDYPADVREALVRAGTASLRNVVVHAGSRYVLSAATFPAYFLPAQDAVSRAWAQLDLTVFAEWIAPALGITARFAGEEPLSATTRIYNEEMLRLLPARGIAVTIIARASLGGEPISASRVRALVRDGHAEAARALVPETTFEALSKIRGKQP